MVTTEAADRFLAAPLLAKLTPAERLAVLGALVERRAEAGATLLEQGEPNDRLAFLIEGAATIVRTFPGGREEVVAALSAPAVFGDLSFFREAAPLASVRADTAVRLLTLDHPAHEALRLDSPRTSEALALAVLRVMAERFDLLDRKLTDFIARGLDNPPRPSELARFRARLFDESNA